MVLIYGTDAASSGHCHCEPEMIRKTERQLCQWLGCLTGNLARREGGLVTRLIVALRYLKAGEAT